MSFASLKKSSKNSFAALAEKMKTDKSGGGGNSNEGFWQPEVDKAGNGYAIIRFLPAPDGEDMPYVKLYNHGFKVGTRWYIENCPTTIGGQCPVCEANNELWETGIQSNQDTVRKRKRQLSYISNILVISDPKHPENEGKVFLFRYGQKIFSKIMGAIQPEFEDETPFNPFDFWEGANFKLKIRNVEGFRNYDKSEFEAPSVLFDGDDAALEALWKTEKSLKSLVAESQFKPYEELKKKFDSVTGAASSGQANNSPSARAASHDDEEDPPFEVEQPKRPSKPAPSASDDDDLAMYAKLLEGE
jgi:hypothetical protein